MPRGGKRKGAGRKLSYDSYKRQYEENQKKLATNGLTMKQRMLSKDEFEARYTQYKNERDMEIAEGKRKTLGNITRDIVDDQTYKLSVKQARAVLKEKRQGMTLMELRAGNWLEQEKKKMEKLYEEMDLEDAEREAQKYISTEFFGS